MINRPWLTQYDPGVPATLGEYPQRTLLDYIDDGLAERPQHPAVLFKGRALSLGELDAQSTAFANALLALGVTKGDRVAVMLPNTPQFFVCELGAWKIGAILVPLNPIYTEEELLGPLKDTAPKVVVTLTPFYGRVKHVQPATPVQHVIATNIKEHFSPLMRLAFTLFMEKKLGHRITLKPGDHWLPDLLAAHRSAPRPAGGPTPDDDAMIRLSGGTTGTPKGVRVHHHGLVCTGLQVKSWFANEFRPWHDVYMLPLPLFHSFGACGVQSVCFVGHNPIALVPNPRDLDDTVKTFERVKPTIFCGVPTLYNALLNHPDVKSGRADFKSLRACVSGAAPLLAETKKRFEAATGARIVEGYALTETLLAATINPIRGTQKLGSVGVPFPDVDAMIVDADDPMKILGPNDVGEIILTGQQIMRGYWNNPEETALMRRVGPDGREWIYSADLGYMDEDGYIFIVDRKKDLIKPGGMQVWPREIEEVLQGHPAVAEVGVRGFPDDYKGEIAVAFVVLREGMTARAEELREYCKEHLAFYKVPGKVVFKRELPKSLVGKVLRRMLTLDEATAS
ncbi:MAG: AMP-binding protein [Gemmatimonadaceae bacterium]|nr:AMP-binding protein [Gemmatimonadaceae bacterium]